MKYKPVGDNNSSSTGFLRLDECLDKWGSINLGQEIQVEYSSRLTVSLGMSYPARKLIRLNHSLLGADSSLLSFTLCHELAHIVVYQRHGTSVAAHGEEWRALMRAAGYPETARMAARGGKRKTTTKRYRHICAVCQAQRLAGSPMINWRCGQCQSQGLDGILVIEPLT